MRKLVDRAVSPVKLRSGDTLHITFHGKDGKITEFCHFGTTKEITINHVVVKEHDALDGMVNVLSISMGEK